MLRTISHHFTLASFLEAHNPLFRSILACFNAFLMSQEPFLIILDTFGKNPKNVDFARVSFQFLAQGLAAVCRISSLTTCLGSSFQGLVGPRAVLAGVPETYRKKSLEGLNATLAGGPFILGSGARKESASHHRCQTRPRFQAHVFAVWARAHGRTRQRKRKVVRSTLLPGPRP